LFLCLTISRVFADDITNDNFVRTYLLGLIVTDKVVMMGIHNTWEPDEKYEHVVHPDTAILHHYTSSYKSDRVVTDTATEKYLETILRAINSTMAALGNF